MDDINEIWNKIKKWINEAAGRIIGKQKDHREVADLMKNVKYYSKIKRKLKTKWVTEMPDTVNKNVSKEKKHKLFRQERKYCLNQRWSKWRLFIITMRQSLSVSEHYKKKDSNHENYWLEIKKVI